MCVVLCVTLKTGTGGGERKRARVGEGYRGLKGFGKGEKRENKRREERDSQQRHDDLFREMGHSILSKVTEPFKLFLISILINLIALCLL